MLRLRADQWDRIREHFPEEHLPDSHPARKPVPIRAVLETVLWILNTGAQWHLLTAGAFVTMILPMLVFLVLQRYFVRGILSGSVKG